MMRRFHEVHRNWLFCDRRKIISISEKGKKYFATNKEEREVAQYHIDAPDNTDKTHKKCDFALYLFDSEDISKDADRLIFIELKGTDIKRALQQIQNSIDDWVAVFHIRPRRMDARVVASCVQNPNIIRSDMFRLKRRLSEYGNGDVQIGSNGNFREDL